MLPYLINCGIGQGERERQREEGRAHCGEKLKDSEKNLFYLQCIILGDGQGRPMQN